MASAEVLKEYLVRLGFSQDQKSTADFKSSLAATAAGVSSLGSGLENLAQRANAAATQVAESLDQMFFAAQRSGASVSALQGLGLAFDRMGLSAGSAQNLVANLFEFIKTQPAAESILQKLGVNMRGPNGELRETVAIFNNLSKSLTHRASTGRPMDMNYASQMAQMLTGASWQEFLAQTQMQDRQAKFQGEHQSMLRKAGFDPDKAKGDARSFSDSLALLGDAFDILRQKVGAAIFAKFGVDLDTFRNWLMDHSKEISDYIIWIIDGILDFANTLAVWFKDHWPDIVKNFHDLEDRVEKLAASFRDKWLPVLKPVWEWIDKLVDRTIGWNNAILLLMGVGLAGWLILYRRLSDPRNAAFAPWLLTVGAIAVALGLMNEALNLLLHPHPGSGWSDSLDQKYNVDNKAVNAHARKLVAAGIPPMVAAAMAANSYAESGDDPSKINPKSLAAGKYQWLGEARDEVEKHYAATHGGMWKKANEFTSDEADAMWWWQLRFGQKKSMGQRALAASTPAGAAHAIAEAEGFADFSKTLSAKDQADLDNRIGMANAAYAALQAAPPKPAVAPAGAGVVDALRALSDARERLMIAKQNAASDTAGHTHFYPPADLTNANAEYKAAQDALVTVAKAAQQSLANAAAAGAPAPGSVSVNSGNTNSNNVTTTNTVDHPVTTIHLNADSHDPQAIAKELEYSLDRSQGNLVRYLSKAIT